MADGSIGVNALIGGVNLSGSVTRGGEGRVSDSATLDPGKAGTLTTRTDADTGVVTVAADHGILDTDTVGLFWDGGSRRGVDVTAVGATTVNINVGAGDNLPTQGDAVVICVETTMEFLFTGDKAESAVVSAGVRANAEFQQSGGTSVLALEFNAESGQINEFWEWHLMPSGGTANPFAGVSVGKVVMSNGDAVNDCLVKVGVTRIN